MLLQTVRALMKLEKLGKHLDLKLYGEFLTWTEKVVIYLQLKGKGLKLLFVNEF